MSQHDKNVTRVTVELPYYYSVKTRNNPLKAHYSLVTDCRVTMAYWSIWLQGHNGLLECLIAGSQWLTGVFDCRVTMAYWRVWLQGHNGLLA